MQGAADVASSAGARCKERRILHQARAPVARSGGSCVKRGRSVQGATNLASSEGAPRRERQILHQARALRAGSERSCIKRGRPLQRATDLASSECARCREHGILHRARAPDSERKKRGQLAAACPLDGPPNTGREVVKISNWPALFSSDLPPSRIAKNRVKISHSSKKVAILVPVRINWPRLSPIIDKVECTRPSLESTESRMGLVEEVQCGHKKRSATEQSFERLR